VRVGQEGQIVIPKKIRDKLGIREGSEVLVSARNDEEIVIRRSSPSTERYVDYFASIYSKKLKKHVNIRKFIEEENIERCCLR